MYIHICKKPECRAGLANHSPLAICFCSTPDVAPEASMKKKSLRIVLMTKLSLWEDQAQ